MFYLHKPKGPRGQRAAEGAEEGPRKRAQKGAAESGPPEELRKITN